MQPRSILKKSDELSDDSDNGDDLCPPEPFVVNIPDNISRIDIDQYLRDVQDLRRKGLNYSYTTDDEDVVEEDEYIEQKPSGSAVSESEPWDEVNSSNTLIPFP